ncbi:MAG: hypothetical protein F6K41_18255, partial [Symploca sp. SIO3E6]|nr:hypothetical protein [Caldora sp. SIO3E6]
TGGRRQEAGGRRQKAGGRRQEAGGRRQEEQEFSLLKNKSDFHELSPHNIRAGFSAGVE